MLIQFKVTNFRSIKETQILSMVASSTPKELAQNTFETGVSAAPRLLRSAAIYGPNAAGKSNFIAALAFMERMVRQSAQRAQVGELIDVAPFQLDASSRGQESEFEIHFIAEGVRYQYGFTVNPKQIISEWLYAYPNNAPQRWFERQYDKDRDQYQYKFSDLFEDKKSREARTNFTIPNNLYLSVAVQKNSQQLLPVFNWFKEKLQYILSMNRLGEGATADLCLDVDGKIKVLAFMNAAGISVKDFSVKKENFSEANLPKSIPSELREHFLKNLQDAVSLDTHFVYSDSNNKPVQFALEDESDGTQALFSFASRWLDLLENDEILFIDEIDTSLHPLIVHHLVKLLHHSNSKSQLIFTTHDTTLLGKRDLMRPDQVWFVERNKTQATELYSLSDYSIRPNDAIEKRYLSGRYGGIPYLSELKTYG